jgi:hypothetical protein
VIVAQPVLFAILLPEPNSGLAARIESEFPTDHYTVTQTQWLVVSTGTAIDVSTRLGITDGAAGSGIVLAVSSYYGRTSMATWEWISAKIGAPKSAA